MRLVIFFLLCLPLVAYDIDQLSIEEKVGQLFIAYFDGEEANEHADKLIRETKIGGIILYDWANGLHNPSHVKRLCNDLQTLASRHVGIPLLIAIDQEGGLVTRLREGFTEFPGNAACGRTEEPLFAYRAALSMGREMESVGINMNFAPVVDVNSSQHPIIGMRAFGQDPTLVAQFGKASMEGYQEAGIIPCLKHFPGYGAVTVDPHHALPSVSKTLSELWTLDLVPYLYLAKNAPAVMTGHLLFPLIDPDNCATLSSIIVQGILREKLHFEGVVITDSLTMAGVLEGYNSIEEVALKALEAGNDILLIGGRDLNQRIAEEVHVDEVISLFRSVVDAVISGTISEQRIDESVRRILTLKERPRRGSMSDRESPGALAREIAERALSVREWRLEGALSQKNIVIVAPTIIATQLKASALLSIGRTTALHLFDGLSIEESLEAVESAESVIFCSYNAWCSASQCALLKRISLLKPTIHIAVVDPCDLDIESQALAKIAIYSPTVCSLQAVAEWMIQQSRSL